MRILLIASAAALLFSSCRYFGGERIDGNGRVVTEQRNVGRFNSVDVGGALEVRVRQDAATSVKIEADENLQQYLEAYTEGNTLTIRQKKGYNLDPSREIIIYVSAPAFEDLDVSGASKLIGETPLTGNELGLHASGASEMNLELKVSKLDTEVSGSSTMELKGSASRFYTEATGASKARCLELVTDEAKVDVSGASDAEVTANKQLDIEASGASHVRYRGNANINQKSSGASDVEKVS